MTNHSNISVKIIQMPLETDEHGNPKNLDFSSIIKQLNDSTPKIHTDSSSTTLDNIPTPSQIFEQASHAVLHQPIALKELSTVFFYHLCHQKQRHNKQLSGESDNHAQNVDKAYLDQVAKALGFNEHFLNYLDALEDKELDHIIKLQKSDPKAAEEYVNQLKTKSPLTTKARYHSQAPIFLIGKTGSGKTHMIKEMCKMFDVNFVAVNAPSISNAGFKGMTLADIGASLLQQSGNSRLKAEHSVIFFDEFDKLFINGDTYLGTYQLSLITEILTIIEGTTPFPVKDDGGIDSSHMLFILGGSFNIHQKNERTPIGFMNKKELQQNPDSQLKLTDFGLPDELAGRIGKIISLQPISNEQMTDILLNSPSSPFVNFQRQLKMVHCTADINADAISHLATDNQDAVKKFGVRGLYQAFHGLSQITEILHEAPDHPYSHYTINADGFERSERPTIQIEIQEPPLPRFTPNSISNYDDYDDMPF